MQRGIVQSDVALAGDLRPGQCDDDAHFGHSAHHHADGGPFGVLAGPL